jgi:hypothetical protein
LEKLSKEELIELALDLECDTSESDDLAERIETAKRTIRSICDDLSDNIEEAVDEIL